MKEPLMARDAAKRPRGAPRRRGSRGARPAHQRKAPPQGRGWRKKRTGLWLAVRIIHLRALLLAQFDEAPMTAAGTRLAAAVSLGRSAGFRRLVPVYYPYCRLPAPDHHSQ